MLSNLIRGTKWMALPTVVSALLNVLKIVVLLRLLSTADFGWFAISSVSVSLGILLLESGANAAIVQKGEQERSLLAASKGFNLCLGIILFLLNILFAILWVWWYQEAQLLWIGLAHGSVLLLHGLGAIDKAILQRDHAFRKWAMIEFIGITIGFLGAMLSGLLHWGVYALIIGVLLQSLTTTVWLWSTSSVPSIGFQFSLISSYRSFIQRHLVERLVTHFVYQMDTLLIGRLLGAEVLGIYDIFKRLLMRPSDMLTSTLERVLFPAFAKMQHQPALLSKLYGQFLNVLLSIQLPLYTLLYLLAPLLLPLIFGTNWKVKTPIFQAMCCLIVAQIMLNPIDTLLLAKDKIHWWTYFSIAIGIAIFPLIYLGASQGLLIVILVQSMLYTLASILVVLFLVLPLLKPIKRAFYWHLISPILGNAMSITIALTITSNWLICSIVFLLFYSLASWWLNPVFFQLIGLKQSK